MGKFSNERMYQVVSSKLDSFGVSRKSTAFEYMRAICMMYIENPELEQESISHVCRILEEDYDVDYKKIFDITKAAIERAWKNRNFDLYREYFPDNTAPPVTQRFLICISHISYEILIQERMGKDGRT